jgi:hypothetical protein
MRKKTSFFSAMTHPRRYGCFLRMPTGDLRTNLTTLADFRQFFLGTLPFISGRVALSGILTRSGPGVAVAARTTAGASQRVNDSPVCRTWQKFHSLTIIGF